LTSGPGQGRFGVGSGMGGISANRWGVPQASQERTTTQEGEDHMANVTVYTNIG